MYLLVCVRLLQSVDILTQIVIPSEARDLQLALQKPCLSVRGAGGAIKFARCVGRFKPKANS
jgi:hypothetical protein